MLLQKIHGFTVTRQKELSELGAVMYQMTHDKTGLELVWLKRDEENKTFGIAFETLPWDDTGVFHILEHSVLCGSDKYRVKEPFVELMKNSLNTFLNAMTFPDKTVYPISSRNDKDFVNLMRVYLDAVFCPLIYSKPEIFHQEGWHYELDEAGNASYKGVVFNEMKGAFASADRMVGGSLNRLLFPDSPYGFESGGDPTAIPNLTYEAFIDSHRRFYAPSNAYVYLDGDLDIDATLAILNDEYLCNYEKTERMAPPALQQPVTGTVEDVYELAANESLEGKNRLSFGKVIGTFADRETLIAAQVLAEVICGTNQSPLPKALLSAGLAEEVKMHVDDGVLQPSMIIDLKNVKEENLAAAEEMVESQLRSLAEGQLDHSQLEAVMANLEFKLRERDYGYAPQGLIFGFNVLESWLYGGAPEANLEIGDLFVKLKEKMDQGYFETLIRRLLLENPHSGKVILRPSHTAGEERRAAEQARLDRETAAWTEADRARIAAQQEVLQAWQNSEDTPEQLATIPQLSLQDIPDQPEQIPTQAQTISGVQVITHPLHTGGIVYTTLYFDADCCNEGDLHSLSFLCGLLGETDTEHHTAGEIINKLRLLCGDFHTTPSVYTIDGDPNQVTTKLCVTFSALESKLPEAVNLVLEVMTGSKFSEEAARDALRQTKMRIFRRAVMGGNSLGFGRIAAQTSPAGVVEECVGGVAYHQWLKAQDENWDFAPLEAKLNTLLKTLVNKKNLIISVTGAAEAAVAALAQTVADRLPERELLPKAQIQPWGKRKEGIVIPADIAFAVMGGNIKLAGGEYSGQLQLAGQIISLGYLWNAIRVQGGAYGAGMVARSNGLTACYSYRDPNGAGSLETYRNCARFLRDFAAQTSDFTGFIIGTVANNFPLLTPRTKAQFGDGMYLTHNTWENRCRLLQQLLGAKAEDLIAIADLVDKTISEGGICLTGGQAQIDKCGQLESVIVL